MAGTRRSHSSSRQYNEFEPLVGHRRFVIDDLSRSTFSACDGIDEVWIVLEFEPCHFDADANILDLDDPVGEVIGFQVLEDDLRRVQFLAVGWKVRHGEVVRKIQIPGLVPSGAIEQTL